MLLKIGKGGHLKMLKLLLPRMKIDDEELRFFLAKIIDDWNSLPMVSYFIAHFQQMGPLPFDPLMKAIETRRLELVKLLIEEMNFDVNKPNWRGQHPVWIACFIGDLECLNYLIERGADFHVMNSNDESLLYLAAFWGNLEVVKYLIKNLALDWKKTNKNGQTPLRIAKINGKSEVELYLSSLK